MKTRTQATIAALCAVLTVSPVSARMGHAEYRDSPYMDYARVVDVEPIVRVVRVSEQIPPRSRRFEASSVTLFSEATALPIASSAPSAPVEFALPLVQ